MTFCVYNWNQKKVPLIRLKGTSGTFFYGEMLSLSFIYAMGDKFIRGFYFRKADRNPFFS